MRALGQSCIATLVVAFHILLASTPTQSLTMHEDYSNKSGILINHSRSIGIAIEKITEANTETQGADVILTEKMHSEMLNEGMALITAVEDATRFSQEISSRSDSPEQCQQQIHTIQQETEQQRSNLSAFAALDVSEKSQRARAMLMLASNMPLLSILATNAQIHMLTTCAIQADG